jgi:3-hydroxymyristoyl/3-hydroxydecanoyl-(acyl carrier protein) dehydratase
MSGTPAAQIDPVVLAVHPGGQTVELELFVPLDLLYFRGHFPRLAILPGVVHIHWAIVFGRRHFPLGASLPTMLQVKFRRLVRPGERLTLDLRYAPEHKRLFFEYRDRSEARSTGHVVLEP